jgi:hypothetical protein
MRSFTIDTQAVVHPVSALDEHIAAAKLGAVHVETRMMPRPLPESTMYRRRSSTENASR